VFSLESALSGEVLGDFVMLAESALAKDTRCGGSARVCGARRCAEKVRDKGRSGRGQQGYVLCDAALKGAGLVAGSQKTFLDKMPGYETRPCTRIGTRLRRRTLEPS